MYNVLQFDGIKDYMSKCMSLIINVKMKQYSGGVAPTIGCINQRNTMQNKLTCTFGAIVIFVFVYPTIHNGRCIDELKYSTALNTVESNFVIGL